MKPEKHLPFLTENMEGIGGRVKQSPDDFRVDEIPLYEACGEGDHVYFKIEKRGLPTNAAVKRLAEYLGVHHGEIASAGLKDAVAVTTQMLSLEHGDEKKIAAYDDGKMRVVWVGRHTNRLKTGHLAGNRFAVKLREVGKKQLPQAKRIFDVLIKRGVPNYFGVQRFGARGDTAQLGEALIRSDVKLFFDTFLGTPQHNEQAQIQAARDAYDAGDYKRALKLWPWKFEDHRRALLALSKKATLEKALFEIDRNMKRLFVSAFQSSVFNDILARRIETLDRLFTGDIATRHVSGGIFLVEDADVEQPRCDGQEISPTGLLPGTRVQMAQGLPGEIEKQVLAERNVTFEIFDTPGAIKSEGTRRALRFCMYQPEIQAGKDDAGEYIELRFCAPSGCYATVLLEEITKHRLGEDHD